MRFYDLLDCAAGVERLWHFGTTWFGLCGVFIARLEERYAVVGVRGAPEGIVVWVMLIDGRCVALR